MTKPITATAALICVDRGLFSLDDRIEKYIPEYKDMEIGKLDENGELVSLGVSPTQPTIRHCLSHSSGIGTYPIGDKIFNTMGVKPGMTLESVVNYHANQYIAFEPGKREFYSPVVGLDVVARVIEIVTGKTFAEFVKEEITEPLGMIDTTFTPSDEQFERAVGMFTVNDGVNVDDYVDPGCVFGNFPTTYFCGGAGLISTAADYLKFCEMLLGDGKRGDVRILSEEAALMMRTPQLPPEVMPVHQIWGLGVRVITMECYARLPVGAFGWSGAFGTHFWIDPVNKIAGIYMKNSRLDGGSGCLTGAMLEDVVSRSFN
jgi:CubicO group peptidase (beta-lactamase class C family)